ncbi:MAG TPA: CDP-alcohol phosphatidyltransferase family protein [Anaerolineae bacterium]|nr:CDP-alcohol phosphatidyltransferase family protein [Anaerolineae bacterium]
MEKKSNSILSFMELPDYLTLLGSAFSILAMIYSINQRFVMAAILLILAVLCDFYDGKIARLINRKNKQFGEVLDTSVDAVSFVAAPVIFGYSLGLRSPIAIAALIFFASIALLRLARFSCVRTTDKGFFVGMPVTYNNLILPIAYLVIHTASVERFLHPVLLLLYFVAALLMSSTIKWIKF